MGEEKPAQVSAAELERMRDVIRQSFDEIRRELEQVEGLLMAARARTASEAELPRPLHDPPAGE